MMSIRHWLWITTVLDVVILVPAFYMAAGAVEVATANPSMPSVAIAALFFALPVFCIAAPAAAWRALNRKAEHVHAGMLAASPIVYAVFLVLFLFSA